MARYEHANHKRFGKLLKYDIGTWVAFDDPSTGGAKGRGMRMKEVGAHPDVWSETSEGFGIAVMHQLHCVVSGPKE